MSKNNKRSMRIHHAKRMKEKAFNKVYGSWVYPSPTEKHDKSIAEAYEMAGRLRNHMAECSCHMCGNPRRHSNRKNVRLTLQEKRFNDKAKTFDY